MERQVPKNFIDNPFPYHHELTVHIDTVTNLGVGIAKVDGWVVMVPYTIPGEKVKVRIYRNHKNYSDADLIEVIEPSPRRISPACNYFQSCGGCQYQHIDYKHQLKIKKQHVEESFLKIGGIEVEAAWPIHTEQTYGYRSKITPHHQKPKDRKLHAIGFLAQGTRNRIIDIERCEIATPEINNQYTLARKERHQLAEKGKLKKGATLLFRHTAEGVISNHATVVTEQVGEYLFQFKAGDFFQNNPYVLPGMVDYVRQQARAAGLPYLIDAYCGSGLFAVSLANGFQEIMGIEISESSIQWARINARINQRDNCQFQVGDAAAIFKEVSFNPDESTLIIDPPRKGCDPEFLEQLFLFSPAHIIYVSCDPATQARDVKVMLENGYTLEKCQPVDLFPQTRHIENVATLRKKLS